MSKSKGFQLVAFRDRIYKSRKITLGKEVLIVSNHLVMAATEAQAKALDELYGLARVNTEVADANS